MAKDKKEQVKKEEVKSAINDLMKELMEETGMVICDDSLSFSHMKVTTPLYALNCIYGGGIPLGIISEVSGPPSSGKSTFLYQCMGNYQREYPEGVAVVYDTESARNIERMRALGVQTDKVLIATSSTLEKSFENVFAVMAKLVESRKSPEHENLTSFQIYDSISAGGTDKQQKSIADGGNAFNAGSMMEQPRIIKQNVSNLMKYLNELPVFIGFINQVFTSPGVYQTKVESGGGYGLKHLCHAHITFSKNDDDWDKGFVLGTTSKMKLSKSRLSPNFIDIPCYMDARESGRIDEVRSFYEYIASDNIKFVKTGAWCNIIGAIEDMASAYNLDMDALKVYSNNFRRLDLIETMRKDKDIIDLLQVKLIDFIVSIYHGQEDVTKDFKKTLVNGCKYFKDKIK